jgi:hypothetical protein
VNVLHRYRDAILDAEPQNQGEVAPKRTVVEGVVLFPYREETPGQFRESRLWQAVQRLGIGAVPALPESCGYLQEWLCRTLRMGGWAIADMAIPYRSHERSFDWRVAAAEAVLVGVLRPDDEQEHLEWIKSKRMYYIPATKQPRQYHTKRVALYLPSSLRHPGAVVFSATVLSVEVVLRSEIATPWKSAHPDSQQTLYRLDSFQTLDRPVENRLSFSRP